MVKAGSSSKIVITVTASVCDIISKMRTTNSRFLSGEEYYFFSPLKDGYQCSVDE